MKKPSCDELLNLIRESREDLGRYSRLWRESNIPVAREKLTEAVDRVEKMLAGFDRIKIRDRAAMALGLDYVGQVYPGGIAWGRQEEEFTESVYLVDVYDNKMLFGPINGYEAHSNFARGACLVEVASWIYLIDKKGRRISDQYYCGQLSDRDCFNHYDGSPIRMRTAENKPFLLTADGKEIFQIDHTLTSFSEGLAWQIRDGGMRIIDESGDTIAEFVRKFAVVNEFHEGYSIALDINKDHTCYDIFCVDKNGHLSEIGLVTTGNNINGLRFHDGWAVGYQGMDCFYFNPAGETIFDSNFDLAYSFSEGIGRVSLVNSEIIFVNQKGERVPVDEKVVDAGDFHDGWAWIASKDGDGDEFVSYINSKGEKLCFADTGLPVEVQSEEDFSEERLVLGIGAEIKIIDTAGRIINDWHIAVAEDKFHEGVLKITDFDDEEYYIDRSGKRVFSRERD